jgi:flavin reductase (DIM6/NTAB) family NADH-FMN oxidoreductase RutF
MHVRSESPILYFGTPVVLITTLNEDGTPNISPMSSAWWLGWRCIIGLESTSKTTENLLRTGQCVLNLPSADQVSHVNAIVRDKFTRAGLTPQASEIVAPPRIHECLVQMEATVAESRPLAGEDPTFGNFVTSIQLSIERLHLDESILQGGNPNRVDTDRWRPLIMSFAQYYGLAEGRLQPSALAEIPDTLYPRAGGEASRGGTTIDQYLTQSGLSL